MNVWSVWWQSCCGIEGEFTKKMCLAIEADLPRGSVYTEEKDGERRSLLKGSWSREVNFSFDCFLWYLSFQSTVEPVELNVSLKTTCVKILPLECCPWRCAGLQELLNLGGCMYGTKLSRPGLRSFWQKYRDAKHPLSSILAQSAELCLSDVTSPSLKYLSILSALLSRYCEVLVRHRGWGWVGVGVGMGGEEGGCDSVQLSLGSGTLRTAL